MLNRYPFAAGHLLVVPHAHVDALEELDPAAHDALFRLVREARRACGAPSTPRGSTSACNLGAVAGRGRRRAPPRAHRAALVGRHQLHARARRTSRDPAGAGGRRCEQLAATSRTSPGTTGDAPSATRRAPPTSTERRSAAAHLPRPQRGLRGGGHRGGAPGALALRAGAGGGLRAPARGQARGAAPRAALGVHPGRVRAHAGLDRPVLLRHRPAPRGRGPGPRGRVAAASPRPRATSGSPPSTRSSPPGPGRADRRAPRQPPSGSRDAQRRRRRSPPPFRLVQAAGRLLRRARRRRRRLPRAARGRVADRAGGEDARLLQRAAPPRRLRQGRRRTSRRTRSSSSTSAARWSSPCRDGIFTLFMTLMLGALHDAHARAHPRRSSAASGRPRRARRSTASWRRLDRGPLRRGARAAHHLPA